MTRYTLVCTACSCGWESDDRSGSCHRCGKVADVRGRTLVLDLTTAAVPA